VSANLKDRIPLKRSFRFTGDLKLYETCPRQYQFFREYDFTPSRSAVIFFGLLVHQTIEEIHRLVLDGKLAELDEPRVRALFDRTFNFLTLADVRPIGPAAHESAFSQVMNYFRQNQAEMQRVLETEVDVSVEKQDYILTGKVDLLMGGDGKLELLDFKTSPRPTNSPKLLQTCERQLCTYAHILEKRYGKRPERLLLYWTAEEKKTDALMQFPYNPSLVDEAVREFDAVAGKIKAHDFRIAALPEKAICKECDMRSYCAAEGVLALLYEPIGALEHARPTRKSCRGAGFRVNFRAMNLAECLKRPEGKTLEFKRELASAEPFLRTVAAFANTAGGIAAIGVEDQTRRVVGVADPLALERHLANLINEHIRPQLLPDIEILPWRRRHVVAVQIHPGPSRPYYLRAVINAVVHADYAQRGAPIRLSIFDDRVEIENPGLLPFGLTIEDIRQGISKLRNRVIGRVFRELGLIEQWGSGIQRMSAACRASGLSEPQFEEVGWHFRVTLFKQRRQPQPPADAVDQAILRALESRDGLSTQQVATAIHRSARATRTRLAGLVRRGLVVDIGSGPRDPRRTYHLTKP